jgi:hypothetical protein
MSKIFDTFCIEAADLNAARMRIEQMIPVRFILHESMYWGGDYYRASSSVFGEITIRKNFNSYTRELNEPEYPDCHFVISINDPLQPDVLQSRLTAQGLLFLRRVVVQEAASYVKDPTRYTTPIGFYREFRGGEPHQPSLRLAAQSCAMPRAADVIRYLNDGKVLVATGGVVSDVLDPKFGIIGPPHILTDGAYAWPAILSHYIEHHHVHLPEEFVSHMVTNNWTISPEMNLHGLKVNWSHRTET